MSSQPAQSLEEDLSNARPLFGDSKPNSHDISPPRSRTSTEKGKAKQLEDDAYDYEDPIENSYPPTSDEAAETRRVEEVRCALFAFAHIQYPPRFFIFVARILY